MAQSDQFHEAFAYIRDNARAVRPDDVYVLADARDFAPPSRAHIKRIERVRPVVTTAKPRVTTDPGNRRAMVNAAAAMARAYGLTK